jgi:hypothetical protein
MVTRLLFGENLLLVETGGEDDSSPSLSLTFGTRPMHGDTERKSVFFLHFFLNGVVDRCGDRDRDLNGHDVTVENGHQP